MPIEVRVLVPVKVIRKVQKQEEPKPIEALPDDWQEKVKIPSRWIVK